MNTYAIVNYSQKDEVFSGINIIYHNIHTKTMELELSDKSKKNAFSIFHCREGRMECKIGGDFCYVSPGDLMIAKTSMLDKTAQFPLGHYHGITIDIDVDLAPECFSCFIKDVAVQPAFIIDKFCHEKAYFIARSNQSFEHIFSELYTVPSEIKQGYFKIKILELMLFLSVFENRDESLSRFISPYKVVLAKKVCDFLTENMNEKFTLEQMAQKFNTSATNIKTAVKAVYGVPFYAFTKSQKMESAAYMLEYTDKTIMQIAGEHGYDNSSKFANAFRSVKGVAPMEYRQINQKNK
ncbi:helix-turn-helix domain-containing protein [Criibacterium bergeronii]|nr:AraC family transcriptional regulator [Criibacterium bergeronii]MBS6064043.1 helix-turn-helix transcriptional regulator [Peptostreptococcaceae bacterium]